MKVIFLDIDGVLRAHNAEDIDTLDPLMVARIQRIINATNCSIVISSDWRLGGTGVGSDLHTQLIKAGGSGVFNSIIGVTRLDNNSGLDDRSIQIADWLSDNNVTSFVIIDDMPFMQTLQKHLVCTDASIGITDDDIDKAINILQT